MGSQLHDSARMKEKKSSKLAMESEKLKKATKCFAHNGCWLIEW